MRLGRLLTGAGMVRSGVGLIRAGQAMRQNQIEAPRIAAKQHRTALINKVRLRTRGIAGTSNPRMYSKNTQAGMRRRQALADRIRGARGYMNPQRRAAMVVLKQQAARNDALTASRTRARAVVSRTRGITRMGFRSDAQTALSKKSKAGKFNRYLLAQSLRRARKGPAQSAMFGYNKSGSARTFDLRRS